jgi:signal transduction histidine kinase
VLGRGQRGSPFEPVIVATALGLGATVAVVSVPSLRFAYESLELHVALESAQGVVALVLCYLSLGRLRATMRLRQLLLTVAFAAFAATNLFVSALPVALERETVGYAMWLAAMLRLLAAVALAAAAVFPDRTVRSDGLARRVAAASILGVAIVVVAAAVANSTLTDLVDPALSPEESRRPLIAGHPVAVAIQITSTAAMAIAARAFLGLAQRTGDDLFRWLAAGATMGAFARLNYVLFPSLYTEWFYTGDLLRFGSYVLFLVGAAREVGKYWREHAQVAVIEERRRVARELHDGLTQELSFIRSQLAPAAARRVSDETLRHVAEAADRALVESRKAVDALTDDRSDRSLADDLRRTAETVAVREGVIVTLDVPPKLAAVVPTVATELERIVREAVVNAVRHGRASVVALSLDVAGTALVLEVNDDGVGFDIQSPAGGPGFGLVSMRQRAAALGGSLHMESCPGRGTTVRVLVPDAFTRGPAGRLPHTE